MDKKIISNKIFVLDNSVVYSKIIEKDIERYGYSVVGVCNDIKDILNKVLELTPDIMVMDIELNADQNGIEIAQQIRQLMSLPIIFISATEKIEHLDVIAKMDNTFFINKPHSRTELFFTIKQALIKRAVNNNLTESEERYRKLVEMSPDTIIIHTRGKINYINKTGLDFFGVREMSLLKDTHILNIVHEDDRQNIKDILLKNLDKDVITDPIEHQIISSAGQVHCVQNVSVAVSFNGKSAVMAVLRDITELKKREKERTELLKHKDWMMREFSHRVANQLALINAFIELIKMSNENITVEELSLEVTTRINTIAILQSILYRYNDFSNINFFIFVNEIIKNLAVLNRKVKFNINIPADYKIKGEKATTLGLWLNEIVINGFKHAFTEQEKPEISVDIELIKNSYWVVVTDNGKGKNMEKLIDTDERFSLGMSLITDILPSQIDGNADYYSEKGKFTKYILNFKQ